MRASCSVFMAIWFVLACACSTATQEDDSASDSLDGKADDGDLDQTFDLNIGRSLHTSTLLFDGRVLVTGGGQPLPDGSYQVLRSSELYGFGVWGFGYPMWVTRTNHRAVRLDDGRVLITGGTASTRLASTELFSPFTNGWLLGAPMSISRESHTSTRLDDGRVLVTGGLTEGDPKHPVSMTEIYDPFTNLWSGSAQMSVRRANHAAVRLLDGRVMVIGGANDTLLLKNCEIYDPASNKWTPAAAMNRPRTHVSATVLDDGRVLAVGPEDLAGTTAGAIDLYDPATDTWSEIAIDPDLIDGELSAQMSVTRVPNGKAAIVAGNKVLVFDPADDSLRLQVKLPPAFPRSGHAATALAFGNRVLITGGYAAADEAGDAYLTPDSLVVDLE